MAIPVSACPVCGTVLAAVGGGVGCKVSSATCEETAVAGEMLFASLVMHDCGTVLTDVAGGVEKESHIVKQWSHMIVTTYVVARVILLQSCV